MDFMTSLFISTDWKRDSYNFILVIVDWLTKMVNYEPIKAIIDAPGLAKIRIDVIIQYYGLLDSIVTNKSSFFTSKFWLSLCYFFGIKRKLFTAFHPKINGQTE